LLKFEIVTRVTAALMHRTAKYFITFTPKCFALAVAAVSIERRAILLKKVQNIEIYVPLFKFCTRRPILRALANPAHSSEELQNSDIAKHSRLLPSAFQHKCSAFCCEAAGLLRCTV